MKSHLLLVFPLFLSFASMAQTGPAPCTIDIPKTVSRNCPSDFDPEMLSVPDSFDLKIYDRWGELRFQANSFSGLQELKQVLEGQRKAAVKLKAGTYYYYFKCFSTYGDMKQEQTGYFTIAE